MVKTSTGLSPSCCAVATLWAGLEGASCDAADEDGAAGDAGTTSGAVAGAADAGVASTVSSAVFLVAVLRTRAGVLVAGDVADAAGSARRPSQSRWGCARRLQHGGHGTGGTRPALVRCSVPFGDRTGEVARFRAAAGVARLLVLGRLLGEVAGDDILASDGVKRPRRHGTCAISFGTHSERQQESETRPSIWRDATLPGRETQSN